MAQVVGAAGLDAAHARSLRERAPAPVAPVVVAPRHAAGSREHELRRRRPALLKPPLGEVLLERAEQGDRTRWLAGLLTFQLAVGDGLFDEQRPLADVSPCEGKRLLRTQPCVGEDGDPARVSQPGRPGAARRAAARSSPAGTGRSRAGVASAACERRGPGSTAVAPTRQRAAGCPGASPSTCGSPRHRCRRTPGRSGTAR